MENITPQTRCSPPMQIANARVCTLGGRQRIKIQSTRIQNVNYHTCLESVTLGFSPGTSAMMCVCTVLSQTGLRLGPNHC